MSFTCQSSFGPSAGHCLSRPVSGDVPLRPGPSHCGQSEVEVLRLAELGTDTAVSDKQSAAIAVSNRNFTEFLLTDCWSGDGFYCSSMYAQFYEMFPAC